MKNHIYTFKIVNNNTTLYKGDEGDNTFKFYQICSYPANSLGHNGDKVHEMREIIYNQSGNYIEKKVLIPKDKYRDFMEKLPITTYRLYPVNSIDNIEITKDIFHLASSQLLS